MEGKSLSGKSEENGRYQGWVIWPDGMYGLGT